MKRLHHCALVALLAIVGVGTVAEFRSKLRAADEKRTVFITNDGIDPIERSARLRERYVEEQRAKATLMSDEEVENALQATQSEVRALQAKNQLDQTAETLKTIVKNFEGTPSAALAQEMLAIHERGPAPNYGNQSYYGAPDPAGRPIPDAGYTDSVYAPDSESTIPLKTNPNSN
jgi:hypothetical protein